MKIKSKVSQVATIRRSVEYQHGVRGVLRMLRRGLHGAKNWALEDDADGMPRSASAKAFRVLTVLAPVWIVVIAVTSDPQQGGESLGAGQSAFMALGVALTGLAWLSARERRLGREEPWAELKRDEPEATESDTEAHEPSIEHETGVSTDILEKSQVEEVEHEESGVFHGDKNEEEEQNAQITLDSVPQAIDTEVNILAPLEESGDQGTVHEGPEGTTSESFDSETDQEPWNAPIESPKVVLEKAITQDAFQQVTADVDEDFDTVPQASTNEPKTVDAESDRNDLPDTPTVPFRAAFQAPFRETETPQVKASEEPFPGTVQTEFQCLYAEAGPYPDQPDHVHPEWWVVAPDVEPAEEPEPASDAVTQVDLPDPWADPAEEPQEPTATPLPVYPEEVQRYFASRVSVDVDETEREFAREAVMKWAAIEVEEGRRTQSEIARLLGIGKATVSRWINAESDGIAE